MVQEACLDPAQIGAYLRGDITDEQAEAAEKHLADCEDCQAIAEKLDSSSDRLIDILRKTPSDSPYLNDMEYQRSVIRGKSICRAPRRRSKLALPHRLGEYRLEKLIDGNMGDVYEAVQSGLERVVAVKLLSPAALTDDSAVRRFQREMKAVGQLVHPNIVRAYDAREIDGQHLLAMELVDGFDLAKAGKRHGRLPIPDACEIARRAALALQCAHDEGLVHRDVKPSNLMLTRDGEVKLLDLGLARFCVPQPGDDDLTHSGMLMGTLPYMAPEQIRNPNQADSRADIYGLGCTLYKLLSDRSPFEAERYAAIPDLMNAHLHKPVPPIRKLRPEVPKGLANVIDRMLAKKPDDRYATAAEAAKALEPFATGHDLPLLAENLQRDATPDPNGNGGVVVESSFPWAQVLSIAVILLLLLGIAGVKLAVDRYGGSRNLGPVAQDQQQGQDDAPPAKPLPSHADQVPDVPLAKSNGPAEPAGQDEPGTAKPAEETTEPEASVPAKPSEETTDPAEPAPAKPSEVMTDPVASAPPNPPTPDGQPIDGQDQSHSSTEPMTPAEAPSEAPADRDGMSGPLGDNWLADLRNETPEFKVHVDMDHPDGTYVDGDLMHFTVRSERAGYLYVLYQSADQSLMCLYPNRHQKEPKIAKDSTVKLPGSDSRLRLRTSAPFGKELIKAIVTVDPIDPARFGVESLTEGDVTKLPDEDKVRETLLELQKQPTQWGESSMQLETRKSARVPSPTLPTGPTMYAGAFRRSG